jgi:adenosylcobinamide kinase / adenosylcobinamide-phosphate guanylyltransferase
MAGGKKASKDMIILITGGARSGKTDLAERFALSSASVAYVATAEAIDDEMRERIDKHRQSRPVHWQTHEVNESILDVIDEALLGAETIIIDCLTVYVGRRMEKPENGEAVIGEIEEIIERAVKAGKTLIMVTNEVGLGLVPDNPVGRAYRDLLGKVNQKAAGLAGRVFLVVAGIPVDVKAIGLKTIASAK